MGGKRERGWQMNLGQTWGLLREIYYGVFERSLFVYTD